MANPSGSNQVLTKIYDAIKNAIRVTGDFALDPTSFFSSNPTIENISTINGIEGNYTLPSDTKQFLLKSRLKATITLSYVSGESDVKYLTIHPGSFYEVKDIQTGIALYFKTNKDDIIEIVSWK